MSNPPPTKGGRPRSILDSGSPRRTMVLRSQPAYISLTARRAQPAGPPPTQPTTPTHTERKMREIQHPHLTDGSPYQVNAGAWRAVAGAGSRSRLVLRLVQKPSASPQPA